MDTQSLFSLAGRTALVTGGSRGIGKMIASGFIGQGAKVYISSRKADVCEAVAEELGPNCIAVPQDISTVEGCKALAATMAEHEDSIDILVNNAGAAWGESFETFPEAGWDKVMNLNVKSIFFLTQAMHDLLKAGASAEQPAKVINIASIDGLRLTPGETYSYQASKAAVINLTKRLAARLVKDGILVTGVAPGAFASEMNKAARDLGDIVNMSPQDASATMKIWPACDLPAARSGNYVVGETIAVDGGVVHAFLTESWEVDPAGGH